MVIVFAGKRDSSATMVIDLLLMNHVEFFHVNEDDQIRVVCIDKSTGDYIIQINESLEVNLLKCTVWNRDSSILKKALLRPYAEKMTEEVLTRFYLSEITKLADYTIKTLPKCTMANR